MGGSAKNQTTTQQVQIPASVLAQYNAVNARANTTANTPFQQYSTSPDAFVAPINAEQTSGINATNTAANQAQPYYTAANSSLNAAQAATTPYYANATSDVGQAQAVGNGLAGASLNSLNGATAAAAPLQSSAASNINSALGSGGAYNGAATNYALAGGQAVDPSQLNSASIQQYLSPYLNTVLGSTANLLNQNNQQQQGGQLGNAITSGAFGGDRAGIAAANLEQQQNLANANIYSGILNTGYNNALSTAQQQQGVGLAAGQANRAATQATAGELQSIGNQSYTQGLGAASAQAALGNQEYGQGANTAAQQAALGAQQFGQGITAANTTAGLGQDIYNTGAATSAAQAALGSGAQTAALQGAQAQLGAGTLQQQTTQAGDTALYNQFLQQQSYPFQVDQFLANIAEGTGALSGSTTTTTQPGGFFSDERLKEDIEPIGKTFDGQNIIKFRYKGDSRKQIGLSAQEVEKHHPDAVGASQGFRTVDYDMATKKAAERGHFAGGGLAGRKMYASGGYPILPGETASDEGALLASQAQMYAPFSGGGLYGNSSSGAPRGGSSYVPQANLPVGHLAVAGAAPAAPQSGASQINQIMNGAGSAQKDYSAVSKLFQPKATASSDAQPSLMDNINQFDGGGGQTSLTDDISQYDTPQFARGGLAGRLHYDTGGDVPGANDNMGPGLDIPDDPSHNQLAVAGAPPPKPSSGFGDLLNGLISAGTKIASMGAAKNGGRIGKDDGGALSFLPDPSDWPQDIGSALGKVGNFLKPGGFDNSKIISQNVGWQASDPTAGGLAGNPAPTPDVPTVGTPVPPWENQVNPVAGPSHEAGGLGRAQVGAPAPAEAPANDVALPTAPDTGMANFRSAQAGMDQVPPMAGPSSVPGLEGAPNLPAAAPAAGGLAGTPASGPPAAAPQHGDFVSGIKNALGKIPEAMHNDPAILPAILSGIAAMGTAPTRSWGVALATGLGAGTNAYSAKQTQLANVANTQAQANQTNAEASRIQVVKAADLALLARSGWVPQLDPNGNIKTEDGKRYSLVRSGSILAGAQNATGPNGAPAAPATAPAYKYLGSNGQQAAGNAIISYATAPDADKANAAAMQGDVVNHANSARSQLPMLNQYADAVASDGRGALLQPGPLNAVKAAWVGNFNDIVRSAGLPNLQINPQGLADKEITDKMATTISLAATQGADQHSLGALNALHSAVPNNSMSPQAATDMVAQRFVQNQRDIDHANYYDEMDKAVQQSGGLPHGYLPRDADQAFGNDFTADRYGHEMGLIKNAMTNGSWAKAQNVIQNGTPAQKQQMIDLLNKVSPGLPRYLTGGQ